MPDLADKIMRRVRARGRGRWVCSPKDFLDLGDRPAVNQALSRLAKSGKLRRLAHGLYDLPRISTVLKQPAPASLDAVIDAIARRDGIRVMPDGLSAANQLGLTNAVPAKATYVTDGTTRVLNIGGRTLHFKHKGPSIMKWAGKPAAPVVQALRWLGPDLVTDPGVVATLNRRLPHSVKRNLIKNRADLPTWATRIVDRLAPT